MKKFLAVFNDIRAKTITVISLSTLLIIAFSVSAGIIYVRRGVSASQEADLMLVAQVTDLYLSSEIKLLKENASTSARRLVAFGEENWKSTMENLLVLFPEFIGLAIFDGSEGSLSRGSCRQ